MSRAVSRCECVPRDGRGSRPHGNTRCAGHMRRAPHSGPNACAPTFKAPQRSSDDFAVKPIPCILAALERRAVTTASELLRGPVPTVAACGDGRARGRRRPAIVVAPYRAGTPIVRMPLSLLAVTVPRRAANSQHAATDPMIDGPARYATASAARGDSGMTRGLVDHSPPRRASLVPGARAR